MLALSSMMLVPFASMFFISLTKLEHAGQLLEWVLGFREVGLHYILDMCPPFVF